MAGFSEQALKAADSICNYCSTRFPDDIPPDQMLDRPWFAEKVQRAIDESSTAQRWTSVFDETPPRSGSRYDKYLCISEEGCLVLEPYQGEPAGEWYDTESDTGYILFWAPVLPKPDNAEFNKQYDRLHAWRDERDR